MRATVNIRKPLLADAKRMAADRGVTLSELVEEALRRHLSAAATPPPHPFRLHVASGALVDPETNPSRTSELLLGDDEASFKPTRG